MYVLHTLTHLEFFVEVIMASNYKYANILHKFFFVDLTIFNIILTYTPYDDYYGLLAVLPAWKFSNQLLPLSRSVIVSLRRHSFSKITVFKVVVIIENISIFSKRARNENKFYFTVAIKEFSFIVFCLKIVNWSIGIYRIARTIPSEITEERNLLLNPSIIKKIYKIENQITAKWLAVWCMCIVCTIIHLFCTVATEINFLLQARLFSLFKIYAAVFFLSSIYSNQ